MGGALVACLLRKDEVVYLHLEGGEALLVVVGAAGGRAQGERLEVVHVGDVGVLHADGVVLGVGRGACARDGEIPEHDGRADEGLRGVGGVGVEHEGVQVLLSVEELQPVLLLRGQHFVLDVGLEALEEGGFVGAAEVAHQGEEAVGGLPCLHFASEAPCGGGGETTRVIVEPEHLPRTVEDQGGGAERGSRQCCREHRRGVVG